MHRHLSVKLVVAIAALSATLFGCANELVVPPEPTEFDALHEEFLYRVPRALDEYGVPGAAVGLITNGEVVLRKGFGVADLTTERPVTSGTVFNVDRISMAFTAWGSLRLTRNERLFEDLPVESQIETWDFPESSFDAHEVTIGRLLAHSGGTSIESYPGYRFGEAIPSLVETLNGNSNGAGEVRLVYRPGSETRISSGGFAVVQLAMQETVFFTDVSFENFMLGSVLLPLGMTSSDFRFPPAITTAMATSYDATGAALPIPRFRVMAAHGLMTTLDDLISYAERSIRVAGGESYNLLPGFTISTLRTLSERAAGESPVYARGNEIRRIGSLVTMGQRGRGDGMRSAIYVDPFREQAVIVLANSASADPLIDYVICRWYEEAADASPAEFCR